MKFCRRTNFLALTSSASVFFCCAVSTARARYSPSTVTAFSNNNNTPIIRKSNDASCRTWARSHSNYQSHRPVESVSSTLPLPLPVRASSASASSRLSRFTLFSSKPPTPDFFKGAPSMPGFKPGQFEKLSSWATSTAANRPIVTEYDPDGLWLWTQWEGTTREMAYKNIIFVAVWAVLVDIYAYQHYNIYLLTTAAVNGGDVGTLMNSLSWNSFEIPHSKDPFIETLMAVNSLWEYQLSLTIFTLSFFVNHAYESWKKSYFCTRAIQGRINDLCMLVTMAAKRTASYGDVEGTTGYRTTFELLDDDTVTESDNHRDAKRLVNDVTRMLRMSHVFFWAAHPTCSDGFGDLDHTEGGIMGDDFALPKDFDPSQYGPMLLNPQGLNMLVKCGQITEREMEALVATGLPPSQYPYVLMEWAGLRCMDGMEAGELRGGPGMEENLLRYFTQLRAEYFSIGDFAAGRMPMAYVQVMEVLVDTLTFLAPLALYVKMGTFNIISTCLLTLFFKGLLELSKSFLDPFGREGYRAHNIRVDVLVSEMNFGASSRWVDAGDALPSELLERNGSSNKSSNESTTTPGAQQAMYTSQEYAEWMDEDCDLPGNGIKDLAGVREVNGAVSVDENRPDVNGLPDEGNGLDNNYLTEAAFQSTNHES